MVCPHIRGSFGEIMAKKITWTDEEVEQLIKLRRQGHNSKKIAEEMGMKESRINNKLCSIEGLRSKRGF